MKLEHYTRHAYQAGQICSDKSASTYPAVSFRRNRAYKPSSSIKGIYIELANKRASLVRGGEGDWRLHMPGGRPHQECSPLYGIVSNYCRFRNRTRYPVFETRALITRHGVVPTTHEVTLIVQEGTSELERH